jgi:glucoamylase
MFEFRRPSLPPAVDPARPSEPCSRRIAINLLWLFGPGLTKNWTPEPYRAVMRLGHVTKGWTDMNDETGSRLADAPGAPGHAPTWTSSAKDAVGCSLGVSRLWFTLGFGIVNEVYYPRVDLPQIRDLGFIVADGKGFWAEVKREANYTLRMLSPGVPAYEIVHSHPAYRLRLRITPDPRRDVLAIEALLDGKPDLRLYVLLAPHLGATGYGNRALVTTHKGRTILWAEQGHFAVALAAVDARQADAIMRGSAGYVGVSDGWQDFHQDGVMSWAYPAAGPGNVALTAELPRRAVLALGFGSSTEAAATLAVSALIQPFENLLQQQVAAWEGWQAGRTERVAVSLDLPQHVADQFMISTTVLRTHLDKTYPGAMVASLSIPWGDSGDERGGYHLVWPRDLVQTAGALLALGAEQEARDTLRYLIAAQLEDGHWHQNQWLGGKPFWQAIQLDETALPVLLAAELAEREALGGVVVDDMVRRALGFIALHGPATEQDRWEENAGINAFTLAVCIAALAAGAEFLDEPARSWALELADFWNANVERWIVCCGDTELKRRLGVSGYYVRTAPAAALHDPQALEQHIPIRNTWDGGGNLPGHSQVSTDFLQLVRLGLRRADDPLILDSLKVVDHLLKVETQHGPAWRRYNGDGYGEHDDGRPFDGTGRGRPWPLLAGERGHYALAAGEDPLPYLEAMAGMASPGGMLPEQIWDAEDIPARRLEFGEATGSAMPLAWAHAEFAKLLVSRQNRQLVDRLRSVWQRYDGRRGVAAHAFWTEQAPIGSMPAGARLVVGLPRPAVVRWGRDGWRHARDQATEDTGLGLHAAVLDTGALFAGHVVDFAYRWAENLDWSSAQMSVSVVAVENDDEVTSYLSLI